MYIEIQRFEKRTIPVSSNFQYRKIRENLIPPPPCRRRFASIRTGDECTLVYSNRRTRNTYNFPREHKRRGAKVGVQEGVWEGFLGFPRPTGHLLHHNTSPISWAEVTGHVPSWRHGNKAFARPVHFSPCNTLITVRTAFQPPSSSLPPFVCCSPPFHSLSLSLVLIQVRLGSVLLWPRVAPTNEEEGRVKYPW